MKITKNNYSALVRGASVYATGGGLEHDNQLAMFRELFQTYESVPVVSCDELEDDDYICTAYGIGSAGNTDIDFSPALQGGMNALQAKTGKHYKALFVGETNIEALTAQIACLMNLPMVDADATGGRAVPEIRLDNFFVAGLSTAPVIVSDLQGNVLCIEDAHDPVSVESAVRSFANNAYLQTAVVFDHSISVRKAKQILTCGTISRSLDVGNYLVSSGEKSIHTLEKICAMQWIARGKILENMVQENRQNGFLEGYVTIGTETNDEYRIFIRNENLVCWKNGKLFCTAPDSIILFEMKERKGVHSSKLYRNMVVDMFVKKATALWRSEEGCRFFHPQWFGIDESVKLL